MARTRRARDFRTYGENVKKGERLAMVIHAILDIVDALVFLGTLTLYQTDFSAKFIFSDFCERLEGL